MDFFTSILEGLGLSGLGLSGLSDVGGALVAFFTTITDYRMWRSLGWLILGVLMIAGGLGMWAKDSAISGVVGSIGSK